MLKIYTRLGSLILISVCCFLWQGCNIINPAEPTPTYIHIDSFHFVQNTAIHLYTLPPNGAASHTGGLVPLSHQTNIAWVYYNNNPIGIFDLPATIPVLATGSGQLEIYPAIIEDGENNSIAIYPFYTSDTFTFAAKPGATITHNPQTGFYFDAKVFTISNFDDGHIYFAPWQGSPGNFKLTDINTPDSVFDGSHSGMIYLSNPSVDSAVDSTSFSFVIPSGTAYIEFDYNSTLPFYVGLQANLSHIISSTPVFLSGIYPNTGWQKFYLKVDGFTSSAQGTSYNFYIKATLSPGQTSGRLLIDNIQLVTF